MARFPTAEMAGVRAGAYSRNKKTQMGEQSASSSVGTRARLPAGDRLEGVAIADGQVPTSRYLPGGTERLRRMRKAEIGERKRETRERLEREQTSPPCTSLIVRSSKEIVTIVLN